MPKRGGLGQRGLDLLISASPGSTDSSDAEKSTAAALIEEQQDKKCFSQCKKGRKVRLEKCIGIKKRNGVKARCQEEYRV